MRFLIITVCITLITGIAKAADYDVGYGSLEAPDDFTFKRTGTTDSFMGTLTRKADGFTISFDIGGMAGTHMFPAKQDKCIFFRTHTLNGRFAWTGIERSDAKQTITTTIYDHGERSRRLVEESSAISKLPAEQRERKAQDLNEKRAQSTKDPPPPANFWADFTREADLAEFLLIVSSYRPKAPLGTSEASKPPTGDRGVKQLRIDLPDTKREITYATLGEDATSTRYYFFYSLPGADEVSKVRLLWNGGAQNKPSITDYYLDGSSILIVERSAERQHLPGLLKGQDATFETVSEHRIKSVNEETLIGAAEPGRLSQEERLALSNLIYALSLIRQPIETGSR